MSEGRFFVDHTEALNKNWLISALRQTAKAIAISAAYADR